MYAYFPDKRFWDEKVAWVTWISVYQPGDLILIDEDFAIVLWEEIVNAELVKGAYNAVTHEYVIVWFLSPCALSQIDAMVTQRLTTYTSVLPEWIGNDSEAMKKRFPKKAIPLERTREIVWINNNAVQFASCKAVVKQQCIVFPDLWTMHQLLPERIFVQPGVARYHWGLSALQKAAIFWWCKTWMIHTLCTTPAWIFQDRRSLGELFVIDEHKRRYKSWNDPRRRAPTACKQIAQVYWAEYRASWFTL